MKRGKTVINPTNLYVKQWGPGWNKPRDYKQNYEMVCFNERNSMKSLTVPAISFACHSNLSKVKATILLTRTACGASRTAVWLVRMHPSNQCYCWVVQSLVFTIICEWIGPAYSANLLARAYDALKERWLLLYPWPEYNHYFSAVTSFWNLTYKHPKA